MSTAVLIVIGLCLTALEHIFMYLPDIPEPLRGLAGCGVILICFAFTQEYIRSGSRGKICKQLYFASVVTAIVNSLLPYLLMRKTGALFGTVQGNIFTALLQGAFLVGIFADTEHNAKRRRTYFVRYFIWQLAFGMLFLPLAAVSGGHLGTVPAATATLCVLFFAEGSLPVAGLMLLFYACRESGRRLGIAYTLYLAVWSCLGTLLPPLIYAQAVRHPEIAAYTMVHAFLRLLETGVSFSPMIVSAPEAPMPAVWHLMLLCALPLMLLWKERKCRDLSRAFLTVYPAVLYVPYLVYAVWYVRRLAAEL